MHDRCEHERMVMYSQFVCSLVSCNVCKRNRDDRTSLTLMHLVDILTIIACGLPSRVRCWDARQSHGERKIGRFSSSSALPEHGIRILRPNIV